LEQGAGSKEYGNRRREKGEGKPEIGVWKPMTG